jgi:3-oxoacyl-[acyl-carrier-protein] synthase II
MVASIGADKQACFASLCQGKEGRRPLGGFDAERFNVKVAYEIADRDASSNGSGGGGHGKGPHDQPLRASRWLGQAIREALAEAGLEAGVLDGSVPVLVGTGLRELRSFELSALGGATLPPAQLHFEGAVRAATPVAGPVFTLSNACAASNYALALAEDLIRLGQAEIVIAAGADSITESMFGLLDRVSPNPPERVQVFDRQRKGVIMGEGAAAVVVESAAHARRRGATPQAILRGVGLSCDAVHETAPDVGGILRALTDAHERAGTRPEDIDVVFVHGTGTLLNDQTEARALAAFFPRDSRTCVLSGIKSMIGHTSGASGLVGVVTAALTLKNAQVPPTVGLADPIDEVADMPIPTSCLERSGMRFAQINAFGFGGLNAVVVLEGPATCAADPMGDRGASEERSEASPGRAPRVGSEAAQ